MFLWSAAVGVEANPVGYTETTSGPTATTFDAYLTNTSTSDIVVNYSVVAAGVGFFDASTFGGTLPSDSVTITAGGTLAPFTIDVPANALGTTPTEQLEVAISLTGQRGRRCSRRRQSLRSTTASRSRALLRSRNCWISTMPVR